MSRRASSLFAALAVWLPSLPAQPPALVPNSSVTIPTSGPLHYSSILIPAGVVVRFTGSAPAVVTCDGDCIVHGTLSAAAVGSTDGPGAVALGAGGAGSSCASMCNGFGCICFGFYNPAGPGVHYGVYGTEIPFSLEGGSPGGGMTSYVSLTGCCNTLFGTGPGGGGGGTLVVLAEGLVDIGGVVDVRGATNGSAGSLLLRGAGGVLLRPSGQLLAGPANASGGIVRIDSWGSPPQLQGTIDAPAPVSLTLPHLQTSAPPTIGTTWPIDVYAPANSPVFVAASTQPGTGAPTPFGPIGVDLANGGIVGAVASTGGHDPRATIPWTIPAQSQLIGLQLWVQGLAWPAALPPRLTNAVSVIVQ